MDASRRILVIDEDHSDRANLSRTLYEHGYMTLESAHPGPAIEAVAAWRPNLVVLQWRSQGAQRHEGDEVALDTLKGQGNCADVPVMLVSRDGSEDARVSGLQRGADDYMVKPLSLPEMMARIKALLRRSDSPAEVIELNGLTVDASNYSATTATSSVRLRPAEFRLLRYFMRYPDRVHTRLQLLNSVWHAREDMVERSVDVHVRRLRQALDQAGHCARIETVRGVGYRFPSECDC
ncbi:MAG: winged helix-turn-helix domain-containing protein [Pseudomonadota bacterium]